MFTSDQPIKSSKEDVLGRVSFAQHLGKAIINYKETDSLVIGLFGSWGSGKTSILNMCLEYVDIESVKYADEEKPIIVKFNPWNFSDQNQLISQFFIQLSSVLGQVDYAKELKVIGEKLEKYASFFEPLSWVPTVGQYVDKISKALKSTGSAAKNWGALKERDLNSTKEELNKLLDKQFHKILIVIDDIDRLNDLEIRQIFQLVKSLGDFSNTIYLLAFDRDVVINALSKVQEGSGVEYLEKLVQIPFEIPLVSSPEVEDILLGQLREVIKDISNSGMDTTYFGNIYYSGFKYFFRNIRDVKRYINSLSFNLELVKGEVNTIDFIAITAIQVFLPEVYYEIRDNKEIFTGINIKYGRNDIEKEQYKKRCDEIVKNANIAYPKLLEFLKRLFPKIETLYSNTNYGIDDLRIWKKDCRICSPDFFERYFRLSIPRGDISQYEIKKILSMCNNPELFAQALENLVEDGRILKFLRWLEEYARGYVLDEDIEPIMTVLMDLGDLFPEKESSTFYKTQHRLSYLFDQLIHHTSNQEKRYSIYKNSMQKATNSLYTIVYEVNELGKEHGRFGPVENLKPEEERTINFQQLNELEELTCEKIKNWANDGRLANHRNLRYILLDWKNWEKEEQINDFVDNLIRTDKGLLSFVSSFLDENSRHVLTDYVDTIKWEININNIETFLRVREIEPRLREIHSLSDFEDLDERSKTAVKLILDAIDGKSEEYT